MMLNEFIKEALLDIKSGIEGANREIGEDIFRLQENSNFIDFDIAVSVESKKQDSAEAKIGSIITVLGLTIGGKFENIDSNITVSRIKFKISSKLIN